MVTSQGEHRPHTRAVPAIPVSQKFPGGRVRRQTSQQAVLWHLSHCVPHIQQKFPAALNKLQVPLPDVLSRRPAGFLPQQWSEMMQDCFSKYPVFVFPVSETAPLPFPWLCRAGLPSHTAFPCPH